MTVPVWQPGTTYATNATVRPISSQVVAVATIDNAGFEAGDTDWTKGTGWTIGSYGAGNAFAGSNSARFIGTGANRLTSQSVIPAIPGQRITASCVVKVASFVAGKPGARVLLSWLDAANAEVGTSVGTLAAELEWTVSEVEGICPAGAEKVVICAETFTAVPPVTLYVDAFTWNHVDLTAPGPFIYRASQVGAATSGSTEPVWPTTVGNTVVDGGVTWTCVQGNRVTWQAAPILLSGGVEPTWPTMVGGVVADNTILWKAAARNVTDENCPNTPVVAIMASKVFAADDDIVRFSATANPLDWTSEQDAGFLATGLQQANANEMAVLAPYRANLASFNANVFQAWQVDPDPASMALLDQMDGIGSTWPKAAVAVGDELLFLSALGVRTVSVSGGNESLTAGDVGMPVDPLVQEAIAAAEAADIEPLGCYYPSLGQYWLLFPGYSMEDAENETTVFVYTRGGAGRPGSWSRYVFPFVITDRPQLLGNDLYFRQGDTINRLDASVTYDELTEGGTQQEFPGRVQWNWIDAGPVAPNKHMNGFDLVATGEPSVSVGYDQRDETRRTTPYAVDPDTLVGGIIPLEVVAPSLSFRVDFAAGTAWSLSSAIIYVQTLRNGP